MQVPKPKPIRLSGSETCEACGAVVADPQKHAEWHDLLLGIARDANLGAMSMRPIGGFR